MNFVEFWGVGKTSSDALPMTTANVSSHLLADWLPSLPPAVGSSFLGWPPFLITTTKFKGNDVLALDEATSRTERQWKSVLSWMLGVAGARHVLESEGYRWIGPVSAFYANAIQSVDVAAWPLSFPTSSLSVVRRPGSRCRLCPDYLALRSTAQRRTSDTPYEWAVAEAKGTRVSLASRRNCPPAWSNQVRNIVVCADGAEIDIPRYLVIATRVNPNAGALNARRLQIRAWNRSHPPVGAYLPVGAAIDIVNAHLFGLFSALRLQDNALAIVVSSQRRRADRRTARLFEPTLGDPERVFQRADVELHERTQAFGEQPAPGAAAAISLDTQFGTVGVDIAEPVITLARKLRHADDPAIAGAILADADSELDAWERFRRPTTHERDVVVLATGIELRLPPHFWRRR